MPFRLLKKLSKALPKPPRKAKNKGSSPWSVAPDWEAVNELPNLRDKDTIPLPWGGQIEHTLNKAVHPLDCEAWPGSPYCDIASTFDVGTVAGLDIEVSVNSCGGMVRATPTLFWLSMAPATIIYRRDSPECQPEVKSELPSQGSTPFGFKPYKYGHWGCMYRIRITTRVQDIDDLPWVYKEDTWDTDFWGPLEGFSTYIDPYDTPSGRLHLSYFQVICHGNAAFYPFEYGNPNWPDVNPSWKPVNVWLRGNIHGPVYTPEDIQFEILSLEEIHGGQMAWTPGLDPWLPAKIQFNQENCEKWKQLPPPPLPELPEENMCNCKAMEADLRSIKKILGTEKGGWKFPKSLSGRGTESVNHDNYADLMAWFAGQMSGLIGDTEIVIKQKDSSLVEEGNQERELKFANLAEAMADTLGLLLENQAKVEAIYRAAAQGLAQAGVAATSAAKGLEYLEDLVDFFDYETEEKSIDFPLFFTPDKDAPHEALKPSTAKLIYQAFTGKRSFGSFRFTLEQMAAIIRAVHWQRVDQASLQRFGEQLDGLRQSRKAVDGSSLSDSDLDTFIESVEAGFPEVPGNVDQSQPYGEPYAQRPRIRKLSKGGQADGGNP